LKRDAIDRAELDLPVGVYYVRMEKLFRTQLADMKREMKAGQNGLVSSRRRNEEERYCGGLASE
jgi:hypothetical protein